MFLRYSLFGLTAISLLALTGCGSSAGTAPTAAVTGVVTYRGQPLSNVNVSFTPDNGRPAIGTTDAQGKFTLSTFAPNDGAVPGEHKVAVVPSGGSEPMPGSPAEAAAPRQTPFPPRYADPNQSGLTASIKPGEKNEVVLQLTD